MFHDFEDWFGPCQVRILTKYYTVFNDLMPDWDDIVWKLFKGSFISFHSVDARQNYSEISSSLQPKIAQS